MDQAPAPVKRGKSGVLDRRAGEVMFENAQRGGDGRASVRLLQASRRSSLDGKVGGHPLSSP